jgi:hypothetical protein
LGKHLVALKDISVKRLSIAGTLVFAAAVALVACGGGSGSAPPAGGGPTATPDGSFTAFSSTTLTLTPGAAPTTVPLPTGGGFGGTVTFPAPTSAVTATLTFTIQNFAPVSDGVPVASSARIPQGVRAVRALPAHTTLLYVGVVSNADITLPSGLSFSVTVPPGVIVPGNSYYVAYYNRLLNDWVVYAGPATVNGNTVTFTANSGPLTLKANVRSWFALVTATVPFPTPSASPVPGALTASPNPVAVNGLGSNNATTITVSENPYAPPRQFGESDTCSPPSGTLATITTGSPQGPSATYTVTGIKGGNCDATFADGFGQSTTVHIVVTGGGFTINGHQRE